MLLFQVDQLAREAVCYEPTTGQYIALLDLRSEDLSCHAEALSDTAHTSGTAASAPILPALLFLMTVQIGFVTSWPPLNLSSTMRGVVTSCAVALQWLSKKSYYFVDFASSNIFVCCSMLFCILNFLSRKIHQSCKFEIISPELRKYKLYKNILMSEIVQVIFKRSWRKTMDVLLSVQRVLVLIVLFSALCYSLSFNHFWKLNR